MNVVEKSEARVFEEKARASHKEFYEGIFGRAFFAQLEEARDYFKDILGALDTDVAVFRAQGSLKQLDTILSDDGLGLLRAIIQKHQEESDGSDVAPEGAEKLAEDGFAVPVESGEKNSGWADRSPKRHLC